MRLRVLTGAFTLTAIALLLAYPLLVGRKPHAVGAYGSYVINGLLYVLALVAALTGAVVCSIIILRQARDEYREEKEKLLRGLLEASLRDHGGNPNDR